MTRTLSPAKPSPSTPPSPGAPLPYPTPNPLAACTPSPGTLTPSWSTTFTGPPSTTTTPLLICNLRTGNTTSWSPVTLDTDLTGIGATADTDAGEFLLPSLGLGVPHSRALLYASPALNATRVSQAGDSIKNATTLRYYLIAWSTTQKTAYVFRDAGIPNTVQHPYST